MIHDREVQPAPTPVASGSGRREQQDARTEHHREDATRASDYPIAVSREVRSSIDPENILESIMRGGGLRYALTGELPSYAHAMRALELRAELAARNGTRSQIDAWNAIFGVSSRALLDVLSPAQLEEYHRIVDNDPFVREWLAEQRTAHGIPQAAQPRATNA
jgi:hypothetical protein